MKRQCSCAQVALSGGRHGLCSPFLAVKQNGAHQKARDWTLFCAPFTEWKAARFPVDTLTVLLPWRLVL